MPPGSASVPGKFQVSLRPGPLFCLNIQFQQLTHYSMVPHQLISSCTLNQSYYTKPSKFVIESYLTTHDSFINLTQSYHDYTPNSILIHHSYNNTIHITFSTRLATPLEPHSTMPVRKTRKAGTNFTHRLASSPSSPCGS